MPGPRRPFPLPLRPQLYKPVVTGNSEASPIAIVVSVERARQVLLNRDPQPKGLLHPNLDCRQGPRSARAREGLGLLGAHDDSELRTADPLHCGRSISNHFFEVSAKSCAVQASDPFRTKPGHVLAHALTGEGTVPVRVATCPLWKEYFKASWRDLQSTVNGYESRSV